MTTQTIDSASHATWFVGASYGGTDDQMPRFLAEGIWENGYDDKLLDVVRSMRPGERIAIKSSYTRKHGLPFDGRGRAVSVMGIKAVGTITETSGPLRDICPFTTMGTFNRSMTDANRKTIAGELAKLLGVTVPVPPSFEGIPVLNNQRSWFFAYADKRGAGDIDALWKVFVAASKMVDGDQLDTRDAFIRAYDEATQVWGVAWNLSTGLYWAHPWEFLTLDSQSRHYINKRLGLNVAISGQQGPCDGRAYLKLLDDLRSRFGEDGYDRFIRNGQYPVRK